MNEAVTHLIDREFSEFIKKDLGEYLKDPKTRRFLPEDLRHRSGEARNVVTEIIMAEFPDDIPAENLERFAHMLGYIFELDQSTRFTESPLHPKLIKTLKKVELDFNQSAQVDAYRRLYLFSFDYNQSPPGHVLKRFLYQIRWRLSGYSRDAIADIPKDLPGEAFVAYVKDCLK